MSRCPDASRPAPVLETSGLDNAGCGCKFGRPTDIGHSTDSAAAKETALMGYDIEGRLLEVCTCNVLCPCWVGADPDGGTCDTAIGWHIDSGTIQGVDVSGLTVAVSAHIPGNILKGNWRALLYVDDRATPAQQEALVSVFTGKLGGPIADLAALMGEVVGIERA